MEGQALDWLLSYVGIPRVSVSCNSPIAARDIGSLAGAPIVYLPNFYPVSEPKSTRDRHPHTLDVGCFGAIRPLKNHLEQAVAAILYAREQGLRLRFHINASRVEGRGESILKSLRGLFAHAKHAELIEHPWLSHAHFVKLCSTMDVGLQVSFSETFNIVSADLVNQGVPVVGSVEIPWLPAPFAASPTSALDIVAKLGYALRHGADRQRYELSAYSRESEKTWLRYLRKV